MKMYIMVVVDGAKIAPVFSHTDRSGKANWNNEAQRAPPLFRLQIHFHIVRSDVHAYKCWSSLTFLDTGQQLSQRRAMCSCTPSFSGLFHNAVRSYDWDSPAQLC
jgi:hypothetical protein